MVTPLNAAPMIAAVRDLLEQQSAKKEKDLSLIKNWKIRRLLKEDKFNSFLAFPENCKLLYFAKRKLWRLNQ